MIFAFKYYFRRDTNLYCLLTRDILSIYRTYKLFKFYIYIHTQSTIPFYIFFVIYNIYKKHAYSVISIFF